MWSPCGSHVAHVKSEHEARDICSHVGKHDPPGYCAKSAELACLNARSSSFGRLGVTEAAVLLCPDGVLLVQHSLFEVRGGMCTEQRNSRGLKNHECQASGFLLARRCSAAAVESAGSVPPVLDTLCRSVGLQCVTPACLQCKDSAGVQALSCLPQSFVVWHCQQWEDKWLLLQGCA